MTICSLDLKSLLQESLLQDVKIKYFYNPVRFSPEY